MPENLWIKCPETGELVFHKDLEENKWVIPASGFHMKCGQGASGRPFDNGTYEKPAAAESGAGSAEVPRLEEI